MSLTAVARDRRRLPAAVAERPRRRRRKAIVFFLALGVQSETVLGNFFGVDSVGGIAGEQRVLVWTRCRRNEACGCPHISDSVNRWVVNEPISVLGTAVQPQASCITRGVAQRLNSCFPLVVPLTSSVSRQRNSQRLGSASTFFFCVSVSNIFSLSPLIEGK
jgi:hypothetical protein